LETAGEATLEVAVEMDQVGGGKVAIDDVALLLDLVFANESENRNQRDATVDDVAQGLEQIFPTINGPNSQ
jgi:hypothetical protein